ncbi:MAG: DUF5615 family PIN-like protein [Bacteroidota bacterium]
MHLLLKDEDFPIETFNKLKEYGHDVLTLNDLALNNIKYSDDKVLETAKSLNRAVVTHNRRDFIKLHKYRVEPHFGIIICKRFEDDIELADAIHELIKDREIKDELLRVIRPNTP